MITLSYISKKFDLDLNKKSPIEIFKINRKLMAQTLNELELNVGVEVGVARGEHAEILYNNIDNLKLYCIDPWEGYIGYNDYSDKRLKTFYNDAMSRLSKFDPVFIKKYSMDAVQDFKDNSLDFVYIDGAHDLKSVVCDLVEWTKKVKYGGIVFGHDYKREVKGKMQRHVVDAVNAYVYSHGIVPWFILGEKGKADDLYREGTRSWMFVKNF